MSRITFDVRYDNSPGLPVRVTFTGTFRPHQGPPIKVYGETLNQVQERLTRAIVEDANNDSY